MTGTDFALTLLTMAGVTYLIRALPFVLVRKKIENPFVLSLLYYAPFAVLGAMTFPDILYATGNPISAGAGFAAALIGAWKKMPMAWVAVIASATAILVQLAIGGL